MAHHVEALHESISAEFQCNSVSRGVDSKRDCREESEGHGKVSTDINIVSSDGTFGIAECNESNRPGLAANEEQEETPKDVAPDPRDGGASMIAASFYKDKGVTRTWSGHETTKETGSLETRRKDAEMTTSSHGEAIDNCISVNFENEPVNVPDIDHDEESKQSRHSTTVENTVVRSDNDQVEDVNVSDLDQDEESDQSQHSEGNKSVGSENDQVEMYIRRLSTTLSDPRELSVDEQFLAHIVREAGESSFGIGAVEVYSFEDPRLVPINWWCSPDILMGSVRSVSSSAPYPEPEVGIPGVDLVGALWAFQESFPRGGMPPTTSFSSLVNMRPALSMLSLSSHRVESAVNVPPGRMAHHLHWRDLQSLMDDPDTLHRPRLEELCSAGFEKATGVAYKCHCNRGIVVYYARAGVDPTQLSAVANETYLRRSAALIGSVLSMAEARRASLAFQRQATQAGSYSGTALDTRDKQWSGSACAVVRERVVTWYRKSWGGECQIPQGMPVSQTLWTILGCFVGLLTMSGLNQLFRSMSDSKYFLVLGPFGALMTLQYGLTAAPASQPRNVVLGQVVAGAVSMAFTHIPLPVWIRQALAPAFAIGAMVKLGIPHPPAGAQSVILAQGSFNWVIYALAILCSIISIIPAVIVNNISQKRQYPTYWGYLPSYLSRILKERKASQETDKTLHLNESDMA